MLIPTKNSISKTVKYSSDISSNGFKIIGLRLVIQVI